MKLSTGISAFVLLTLLPDFVSADISSGLIAYWRMDDGTGSSSAVDATGNGRTGTLTGGGSFVAGKLVGGVDLDGSDDRIVVAHHSSLSPTDITVAAWINPDTWSSMVAITSIVSKQSSPAGFPAFDFRKTTFATGLSAAIAVGSTNYVATGPGNISTGSWQHVAFTYNRDTLIVYINGAAGTPNTTPSGDLTGDSVDLWIGGNPTYFTDRYYDGKIDEVRIYNRALIATDVTELYNFRRPEPVTRTIPGSAAVDPVGSTIPGGP